MAEFSGIITVCDCVNHYPTMYRALKNAGWFPASVFIINLILDKKLDIYSVRPYFDIPMHFIGGVAMAYFLGHLFKEFASRGFLGKPNKTLLLILTFFAACTVAIFWEFYEFTADYFFQTSVQGGIPDTMLDLLMGMIGAIFGSHLGNCKIGLGHDFGGDAGSRTRVQK